jgi:hypothetical protein
MDDMTAFERQVAGEFVRRAGPVRPVNAAAIFTAITATQSPRLAFQSMFSATRFVVAGAIVALFGGLLLAGMLTQPSDDRLPAVGASPSSPAATVGDPTGPPGSVFVDGGAITVDYGTNREETFPIFRYLRGIMFIADEPWCRRTLGALAPAAAYTATQLADCLTWVDEQPIRGDRETVVLPETWAVRVAMRAGLFAWPDPGPTGPPGSEYAGSAENVFAGDTVSEAPFEIFWYGEPDLMFTADEAWCRAALSVLDVEVNPVSTRGCVGLVRASPFTSGGNNLIMPETWAVRIAKVNGMFPEEE